VIPDARSNSATYSHRPASIRHSAAPHSAAPFSAGPPGRPPMFRNERTLELSVTPQHLERGTRREHNFPERDSLETHKDCLPDTCDDAMIRMSGACHQLQLACPSSQSDRCHAQGAAGQTHPAAAPRVHNALYATKTGSGLKPAGPAGCQATLTPTNPKHCGRTTQRFRALHTSRRRNDSKIQTAVHDTGLQTSSNRVTGHPWRPSEVRPSAVSDQLQHPLHPRSSPDQCPRHQHHAWHCQS
jgi:hypothetical protein